MRSHRNAVIEILTKVLGFSSRKIKEKEIQFLSSALAYRGTDRRKNSGAEIRFYGFLKS
jgi:hypothetical protein